MGGSLQKAYDAKGCQGRYHICESDFSYSFETGNWFAFG